ncbi:MAG TPA: hypothetical protein VK766_11485 [Cytophagaceae bacterium]|jgi:hypothetical protein|nr:hypothetical protein [Cytophagaceae bacterium]
MKSFLLFFIVMSNATFSFSQNISAKEIDIDKLIQDLLPPQDQEINYDEVYDALYQYFLTPLDLNKADREDLEALYLLKPSEINAFLEYTIKNGPLVSIFELQAIQGWEINTIRDLLPFVVVENNVHGKKIVERILHSPNHFILFRTDFIPQVRKGYKPTKSGNKVYQGSPFHYLMRYRNSVNKDFSFGLTMEKDAGEPIKWQPKRKEYLMDYLSMHAFMFNQGKWKAIGIGDYKLQFGQGLVLGGGFYIGKSAETILAIKKNNKGIVPYTSVMETDFLRGICFTYSILKNTEITGFYSNNRRDANIQFDSLKMRSFVRSFNTSGMHRTQSEINSKRNVTEQTSGGNVSFYSTNKKMHSGISYVHTSFSKPIQETNRIYNHFDIEGQLNSVASIDYSLVLQNFTTFGEAALSSRKGKALLLGGMASLSAKIDFSFLYRNYNIYFNSLYCNAFSEGSGTTNENGSYWGIRIKPTSKWTMSAYYDHFIFPWLKYQKDSPTEGFGYLGRCQYQPSKKVLLYFQFRNEESGKNQSNNTSPIDFTVPSHKNNYLLNMDYNMDNVSLRSRVQWSSYRQTTNTTHGFIVTQDLNFDFHRFRINTRYALFDTDDYDNRQYSYEKDVLYSVAFPAYYGKGSRTYLIFQFKLGKKTDLWFRYATTQYYNKKTIGSGSDEISGSRVSELKFQVLVRL